jgi:hypothetical protein
VPAKHVLVEDLPVSQAAVYAHGVQQDTTAQQGPWKSKYVMKSSTAQQVQSKQWNAQLGSIAIRPVDQAPRHCAL